MDTKGRRHCQCTGSQKLDILLSGFLMVVHRGPGLSSIMPSGKKKKKTMAVWVLEGRPVHTSKKDSKTYLRFGVKLTNDRDGQYNLKRRLLAFIMDFVVHISNSVINVRNHSIQHDLLLFIWKMFRNLNDTTSLKISWVSILRHQESQGVIVYVVVSPLNNLWVIKLGVWFECLSL